MKDNLEKVRKWLNGKRTYLTAAVSVIGFLVAWATGNIDNQVAAQSIVGCVLAVFIRAGVGNNSGVK